MICSCERNGSRTHSSSMSIIISFELADEYTKSPTQIQENDINNINILLYDNQGKLAQWKYIDGSVHNTSLDISRDLEYSIYVLANVGNITLANSDILTEEKILQYHKSFSNIESLITSQGAIPLSGKYDRCILSNETNISIPLERVISKFRIIIDKSGLSSDVTKFDITKVELKNLNNKVHFFTQSKALTSEDINPSDGVKIGDELLNIYTTGVDFYLSENMQGDLLTNNTDEKSHIPPTEKEELCTYIELTVDYSSSTQYTDQLIYRYYLHDGRFLDNFDIKRNTMYTCKTIFSGSGINEDTWRIDASSMKLFVTDISIIPNESELYKNQTIQLSANILPINAFNKDIRWESSNTDIAIVNQNGMVTAKSQGSCTISAIATYGGARGSALVKVKEDGFSIDRVPILYPGYNTPYTITHTAYPDGTPLYSLTLNSGEECLGLYGCTLSAGYFGSATSGIIGEYTLTGSLNGITREEGITVSLGSIRISAPQNIPVGTSAAATITTLSPSDVGVNWSSNRPQVLSVDNNGNISTHTKGNAIITATTSIGASHKALIRVIEPTINVPSSIEVTEGRTIQIPLTTSPSTSKDYIVWSVINSSEYISIDSNGNLTGLKKTSGYDATIRATYSLYPSVYKDISVKVNPSLILTASYDKMLNTNFTTSDVLGYPTSININLTTDAPGNTEWLLFNSMNFAIPFEDAFIISSSNILTPKEYTQGEFYLQAKKGGYYSNKIRIKVYMYLEYGLSMFIHSYDKEKDIVTGDYEIFTSWTPYSWSAIRAHSTWYYAFLNYSDFHLLKVDNTYGYTLMTTPNNSPIEVSAINPYYFEYDSSIEPYPEHNLARHLIPVSLLKYQDSTQYEGTEGIAIES